ncbi:hypothetical protein PanWU01x14_206620 [Parasponia andersonii]|uniref:Uncharacterized protein n=1 Tax=Parasponia andersonii TaxID=3476 RepID=A0A2P5BVL1_PARAD|nr:hypothetical protein PanWU01x14_206620 [Parasponia andersonii]
MAHTFCNKLVTPPTEGFTTFCKGQIQFYPQSRSDRTSRTLPTYPRGSTRSICTSHSHPPTALLENTSLRRRPPETSFSSAATLWPARVAVTVAWWC